MLYVDTGCLLKLYFPEPDSASVVADAKGEELCFTDLHHLEIENAFELKLFRGTASPEQISASRSAIAADLGSGKLVSMWCDWALEFDVARTLSGHLSAATGCRTLDVLHCAAGQEIGPFALLSRDKRQIALAKLAGLRLRYSPGEINGA